MWYNLWPSSEDQQKTNQFQSSLIQVLFGFAVFVDEAEGLEG